MADIRDDLLAAVEMWKARAEEADRALLIGSQVNDALRAEVERLRQAHWDGRAIGGFDNDGDPTPRAIVSDFAALILSDWKDERARIDERDAEADALERALSEARKGSAALKVALCEVLDTAYGEDFDDACDKASALLRAAASRETSPQEDR